MRRTDLWPLACEVPDFSAKSRRLTLLFARLEHRRAIIHFSSRAWRLTQRPTEFLFPPDSIMEMQHYARPATSLLLAKSRGLEFRKRQNAIEHILLRPTN